MKRNKIKYYKDFGESNDELFERLVDQISEIVTGIEDHEIIFIRKDEVITRGYRCQKSFEEEYLKKVFEEVSRRTNIGVELIEDLAIYRIKYIEQPYLTRKLRSGNNL